VEEAWRIEPRTAKLRAAEPELREEEDERDCGAFFDH